MQLLLSLSRTDRCGAGLSFIICCDYLWSIRIKKIVSTAHGITNQVRDLARNENFLDSDWLMNGVWFSATSLIEIKNS